MSVRQLRAFVDGGLSLAAPAAGAAEDEDGRGPPDADEVWRLARDREDLWRAARACWMLVVARDRGEGPGPDSGALLADLRQTPVLADPNRHESVRLRILALILRTTVAWAEGDDDNVQRGMPGLQSLAESHASSPDPGRRLLALHAGRLVALWRRRVARDGPLSLYQDAVRDLRQGASAEVVAAHIAREREHHEVSSSSEVRSADAVASAAAQILLLRATLLRQCGAYTEALSCVEASIVSAKSSGVRITSLRAALESIVTTAESGLAPPSEDACSLFCRLFSSYQAALADLTGGSIALCLEAGRCTRCSEPCKSACLATDLILACLRCEEPKLAKFVLDRIEASGAEPLKRASLHAACALGEGEAVDPVALTSIAAAETSEAAADLLRARAFAATAGGPKHAEAFKLLAQRKHAGETLVALEARVNHALISVSLADRLGLAFEDNGLTAIRDLRNVIQDLDKAIPGQVSQKAVDKMREDTIYNLTLLEIRAGDHDIAADRWLSARGIEASLEDSLIEELARIRGDLMVALDKGFAYEMRQLDRFCVEQAITRARSAPLQEDPQAWREDSV